MPAKKQPTTEKEQAERFRRGAQSLIDAGELDPTEADAALDKLVRRAADQRDDDSRREKGA